MRKILRYSLLVIGIAFSFLFSPRQTKGPNTFCPINHVELNRFMGVYISCDSYTFVGASVRPAYLLQQNFTRHPRPAYFWIGYSFGHILNFLSRPFHNSIQVYLEKKTSGTIIERQSDNLVIYACVYAGLIVFNFLVLLGSLIVFEKIMNLVSGKWINGDYVFLVFLFLLLSNQLVKYFFWTPHQQVLNIFTPLLAIYFGLGILKKQVSFSASVLYSALSGILLLIYGNAILLLAALVIGTLLNYSKRASSILQLVKKISLITIIFLIPTFGWIFFLKSHGITYYNHEVTFYRNFVWIIDGITYPGVSLRSMIKESLYLFSQTFGGLVFPVMITLVTLFLLVKLSPRDDRSIFKTSRELYFILSMFLLTLLFYWLLGKNSYADRYTYSAAPYLIVLAAVITNKFRMTRGQKIAFALIAVSYHVYMIFYDPFHFSGLFYY